MPDQSQKRRPNAVTGRVANLFDQPLSGLIVRAYDLNLRDEEFLAEDITGRDGRYRIIWTYEQLKGRNRKGADIAVRVFSREKQALLYEMDIDEVRFNSAGHEEINVVIGEALMAPELVEYDHLAREVRFLAGDITFSKLEESKTHRDVTFLSRELEVSSDRIEHFLLAHRLEELSRVGAPFFYALFRKNTLLSKQGSGTLHARLSIGLNDDPKLLLYDVARLDPQRVREDVEAAIAEMIVSDNLAGNLDKYLKLLQRLAKEAEAYYEREYPKKALNILVDFLEEGKVKEAGALFEAHRSDVTTFIRKLTDPAFFNTGERPDDHRPQLTAGQLAGFGKEAIPKVAELKDIKRSKDLKRLARLNKTEWVKALTEVSGKSRLKKEEKAAIDTFSSTIVRRLEKTYPTIAFAAQLEREKQQLYEQQEGIVGFLNKYEDFDLGRDQIDLYFKKKRVAKKVAGPISDELKSIQRVFKLAPQYRKVNTLRREGIHSAQHVVAAGKDRFVRDIAPKAGIEAQEAEAIYQRSIKVNTAAVLLLGKLQDLGTALDISALKTPALAKKLQSVSEDFPNLKILFQSTDNCACQHCRSVYSPAAYLVEILEFLNQRSVTDLTQTPAVTANFARDVLFERRPDLGEIDLGCENANTPVKYIDLVCELLEDAVAADPGIDFTGVLSDGADPLRGRISNALLTALQAAGIPVTEKAVVYETETETGSATTLPHYLRDKKAVCKIVSGGGSNYKVYRLRQTLSTAEELAAAPEYVNQEAYNTLRNQHFAFGLPFDLNHVEAKAYFDRFGLSRAQLMEDFQVAGVPAEAEIAAERLGLTAAERNIVVTPKATQADQQLVWNAPAQWDSPPVSGTVLDYMTRVDHFLIKTALSYADLDLLLSLSFIDPTDKLFIRSLDLNCDTSQKEIANLDLAALDRIHRFLRLQRKTGWSMTVLNEIITQSKLGNNQLDDAGLIKAAHLWQLSRRSGVPLEECIGFYGTIPFESLPSETFQPLYEKTFLNKARNGVIDDRLLPEKIDGSQPLSSVLTSIALSLQLSEQDLGQLLPLLPDGDLNFANLSYLFAAARLMKKLRLKITEFVVLTELTGLNISDSPESTLDFVQATAEFKQSPLKADAVKFMLRHEADLLPDLDEKITQILEALQRAYQDNFTANRSPFDANLSAQEQQETLLNQLSTLGGVDLEDVKTLVGFVERNWTSAAAAKTFTDDQLGALLDTSGIKAAIDTLDTAPGPDISAEQKALVEGFLTAVANYQLALGKAAILHQQLADAFRVDPELVPVVLRYARLQQPGPGSELLSDLLVTDTLIDTDPSHIPPVLPTVALPQFSDQFAALRLLSKLLPLIEAFELNTDQIAWHFEYNPQLGWLEWDSIPYQTGQTPVSYDQYIDFVGIVELARQLPPVVNPLDAEQPVSMRSIAEFLVAGSTATRAQLIDALALLTAHERIVIDEVDAHLFPAFSLNTYREVTNWRKLLTGAERLRQLSADISQINAYIKPVLLDSDVQLLRAALKSRYDEATWLRTLEEISDTVRPQKRDALVAYLLATNPELKDANDLYDYFLVDVEMEACMPSSRIVQAHGTVQLFVQRCLMGLEPKAAANREQDKSWVQWEWMKNYRVWEANRKVFLYPENWIEAELRDEKSFLFTEFEDLIQQNEMTDTAAEAALTDYLEKLDNLAFLEVVATWYQVDIKKMHVFARTKGGDPAKYYYRRFEQERYWTPWERVDLDITGDQLLAFVRNDRLTLAWPVYSEVPDPNQGATVPTQNDPTEQPVDRPRKKLKIQLAISEFANNRWQPKKVSKDGMLTPSNFTTDLIPRDQYNLLYFEAGDQIWIYSTDNKENIELSEINGIFLLNGCKGYPELEFEGNQRFLDFYPDFKDTLLQSQRYIEQKQIPPDDLSARTALSFFQFYEILGVTPGTFRISYPHQFTAIDLLALILEYYIWLLLKKVASDYQGKFKIPLGTMLPYFMEDSKHAYVITPGFYKRERDPDASTETYFLTDAERRTASDIFQLIEDFIKFFQKKTAQFKAEPPADTNAAIHDILTDNDFQDILIELAKYEIFDFFFTYLISINADPELDAWLTGLRDEEGLFYGEQFKNLYHPLVCNLRRILYRDGVADLMKRETQLQQTDFKFSSYVPNPQLVVRGYRKEEDGTQSLSYPVEDLDFSTDGSYSVYNWELFFHVPFLLATRLTQNQRFEESMKWFHYIFNPTGALSGSSPQKYWVTKPFYLNQNSDYTAQLIDNLLYKVADPGTPEIKELEFAIDQWREKPFRPHAVARFRPVAYQKAVLMKYIDNLTEWGDYLFRQDTMESIVQATQMYILADKLLGPKPASVPPAVTPPYETYNQIGAKLDAFGNALIELENILPDLSVLPEGGAELPPPPLTLSMLYFCIPTNDKMLEYWDRIEDRLFKIRHCQNIDGVERSLALFAPPIDPGMLVRAAASGLNISDVLAGFNAPAPHYRFSILSQKATEMTQEVRSLGISLLQTLEKKDAEALALLRSEMEINLLNAVQDLKQMRIEEADEEIAILERTKKTVEERHDYYATIEKIIAKEQLNLDKMEEAKDWQLAANVTYTLMAGLALIPDFALGASGFGGSPHAAAKFGGTLLAHGTDAIGKGLGIFSALASYEANKASVLGGYDRRFSDWKLQEQLAQHELDTVDKQIEAARLRKEMAEKDLENHLLQTENAEKVDEFMHSKYTNKELYDWMISQITSVYFRSYQLAHDLAKKAERSYRFELGADEYFISFGYWDSMKKGLLSANHLLYDLKRMEAGYLEKNRREYELTKHVSLAGLDPLALIRLQATGVCDFDIPEVLYDLDYSGHYFRRIKTVSITLPCIAGPHTTISAKLSLISNRYRKNTNANNLAGTGYPEDPGNDERFIYNVGAIQSIGASNAQDDSGLFELDFRDARYLPFEGTGAISSWRLELPTEIRQFDYSTISDVVIHVKYTAREGGSSLQGLANAALQDSLTAIRQQLSRQGLHIAINLKHDMPNEWHLLKTNGSTNINVGLSRLPYLAQALGASIEEVMFVAQITGNPASFSVNVDGAALNLSRIDDWALCTGINSTITLDTDFNLSVAAAQLANLEEMILVVKYAF